MGIHRSSTLLITALLSIINVYAEKVPVDLPEPDSTALHPLSYVKPERPDGFINRIVHYFSEANTPRTDGKFDISFLGGPYYSSEESVGVGIVAAGRYGKPIIDRKDGISQYSDISIYGNLSVIGCVMAGLRGSHIFPSDNMRFIYDFYLSNAPSRFWGIGYDHGKYAHRYTKFMELSIAGNASWLFRLKKHGFIGPAIDVSHYRASRISDSSIWGNLNKHTLSVGIGAEFIYDKRDNPTGPTRGIFLNGSVKGYPRFFGNGKNQFMNIDASLCYYHSLWKNATFASNFHASLSAGKVPWSMMPTFGGSYTMRGYYKGRFRDKKELDLTVELRQKIWKRWGVAVWGGAGTVCGNFDSIRLNHILANGGVGLRWQFKQNSNVRVDIGFGRGDYAVIFNINEAF